MREDPAHEGPRPPVILLAIIRASLPAEDRDALILELEALWLRRVRRDGRAAANRWLARQTLGFVFRVGVFRWIPDRQTIESLVSDARISMRTMRRERTFVLSFVLTLAIATGVLTAAYGAANWVLLRPVPGVRDSDGLITMRLNARGRPAHITWDVSQPDLATLRERVPQLTELAAMTPIDVDVRAGSDLPRRMAAELVTSNYFRLLGAGLHAGRAFTAEDAEMRAGGVVVLSYSLARALSSDPAAVVGTDLRVNGAVHRVIGVAEREFRGAELPGRPMLWLPAGALSVVDRTAGPTALSDRRFVVWRRMIGRLAPGASPEQVAVAANGVIRVVRGEFGIRDSYNADTFEFRVFAGVGLDEGVRALVERTLVLLLGAAGFLVCLAVANLTNLALARTLARSEVMAVRLALGASRARIIRGVIVETLILGAAGGAMALVFATVWSRWFDRAQLNEVGGSLDGIHVDLRVAGFALITSLLAAGVAFLRPALMSRQLPLEQLMRRARAGARGSWLRATLVGFQVALSVVLLVAAMLLSRTVVNLRNIDLGFSTDDLVIAAADPQLHGYDLVRSDKIMREVERRLLLEPGVISAGVISPTPLRSGYFTAAVDRDDDVDGSKTIIGAGYYVTPRFLSTLDVPVLAGDRHWRADSGTVVLTREMLRQVYPELSPTNAIGRVVVRRKTRERIAAVVADVKLSHLTGDPPPVVFRPLTESVVNEPVTIFVRTAGARTNGAETIARVMAAVAPDIPIHDARSARDAVDLQFIERRIMAVVASSLGALGVVLAAIGLYGVLANIVAAGQREIAIRAALGATPAAIVSRVVARGFLPVAIGAAVGLAGAAAVGRLLAAQLFGLSALDPLAYGWGLAATLALALLACLPPAYRATRVSIVEMLRAD